MPSPLKKPITRVLSFTERGKRVVVRITEEGIHMKQEGQRWTSAVTCTWAAAFSAACKLEAQRATEARPARRVRRGLL